MSTKTEILRRITGGRCAKKWAMNAELQSRLIMAKGGGGQTISFMEGGSSWGQWWEKKARCDSLTCFWKD